MAGSRLDKIGNIFSRATGLLRTGAIKYEDRPIWYDVYRVFPPKYEPRFNREVDSDKEILPIFYAEDLVRADFLKKYGLNPGGMTRNLKKYGEEDLCQRFIQDYNSVKVNNPEWTHEEIFESVSSNYAVPSRRSTIGSFSSAYASESESYGEIDAHGDQVKRPRGKKLSFITHETLLSMFKEAKEESANKQETASADSSQNTNSDSTKSS